MTIRVLDPVGLTAQAERLLGLSVRLQACHRTLEAALELADRDPVAVAALLSAADEAAEWGRQFGERAEWAEGHDPFTGSGVMVDGLAAPDAVLGDVGATGTASGWEIPGASAMWQPWRSFGQQARQAVAREGLEWPDDRPPLSTVLGPIGSLLAEISGVADAKRCIQGSLPDCGWFAAGLVPWGRMARIAHLARFADEGGGAVARLARAESATDGMRLGRSLAAREIGSGHAYRKHVVERGEFPWLRSQEDFVQHVEQVMEVGESRSLTGGRTAFWDGRTGTVVIRDPMRADGGTAFVPLSRSPVLHRTEMRNMEIIATDVEETTVRLTAAELAALANALNEVCHGPDAIEEWEFHARIGLEYPKAQRLLGQIRAVSQSHGD